MHSASEPRTSRSSGGRYDQSQPLIIPAVEQAPARPAIVDEEQRRQTFLTQLTHCRRLRHHARGGGYNEKVRRGVIHRLPSCSPTLQNQRRGVRRPAARTEDNGVLARIRVGEEAGAVVTRFEITRGIARSASAQANQFAAHNRLRVAGTGQARIYRTRPPRRNPVRSADKLPLETSDEYLDDRVRCRHQLHPEHANTALNRRLGQRLVPGSAGEPNTHSLDIFQMCTKIHCGSFRSDDDPHVCISTPLDVDRVFSDSTHSHNITLEVSSFSGTSTPAPLVLQMIRST